MSETSEELRNKIEKATELESVVSTMKALAGANISQYERAVVALDEYYTTVELGLLACFNQQKEALGKRPESTYEHKFGAVVFGSDQGLVGQFNDVLADFVQHTLRHFPGKKKIWAVGERMYSQLLDLGIPVAGLFEVPNSVSAITPLVGKIVSECEAPLLYIIHNKPTARGLYTPTRKRLLPLDTRWINEITTLQWPTERIPEVLGNPETTLKALVREYLFVSLFQACAESMASENASRLAAMQRAEKNINEMLDELRQTYNRLRQNSIDNELFDLIAGFEALRKS